MIFNEAFDKWLLTRPEAEHICSEMPQDISQMKI